MKYKLLLIQFIFSTYLFSQNQNIKKIIPDDLTNSFYRDRFNINQDQKNIDSAVYYLNLISLTKKGSETVSTIVHRGFASSYWGLNQQNETKETIYKILLKLKESNNYDILKITLPLFYASSIEANIADDIKINLLVKEFIRTQLSNKNIFQNKIYRYGLIIYDQISKKETLKELSKYLLDKIRENIKTIVDSKIITSSTSLGNLENKVWTKWMYSCANYFTALSKLKDGANVEAQKYFLIANNYSVDIWSKKYNIFYYRDMIYIFKKEKSFNKDYIEYLANDLKQKENTLNIFFAEVVLNPSLKSELKVFYTKYFSTQTSFDTYWLKSLNKIAKKAPAISLKTINNTDFSTLKENGKWILVDFWGTWCIPCRNEHPDLELFYQTTVKPNSDKITLLTIACKDDYEKVIDYIQQSNFTFPVAIADKKVENNYKISGYPSKILITPQGKYIPISLDVNWMDFVKYYVDL